MDKNSERELDPRRCRELRQIDRQIRNDIEQLSKDRNRLMDNLEAKRQELRERAAERDRLQSQIAMLAAGTVVTSGSTVTRAMHQLQHNPTASHVIFNLTQVYGAIDTLEQEINQLDNRRIASNHHQSRLEQRLRENALRLQALNCVI
jgi:hypothetical protein